MVHDACMSIDTHDEQRPAIQGADPRPLMARAIGVAAPIVAGVQPEQLHLPTPCHGFDVEQLVGHLLFSLDRAAAVGRGDELGLQDDVVNSSDWSADLRVRATEVADAWADDSRLTASVELPWATMTGEQALEVYVNEVTVHTWDLARATGQHPAWDNEVTAAAMRAITRELPVADRGPIWASFLADAPEGAAFEAPFADAVDVPDDATAIDRLVAWNGRQP